MPVILAHVAAHRGVAKDRKETVEQRSVEDALAAGKVFDELDTDGTATITAPQLRELLQRVTGSDRDAPAGDGAAGVAFGGDDAVALPKDAVLAAVSKFRYYLQRVDRIDRIFAEFDTNKSGALEREQIKRCLQNLEDSLKGSKARDAFGVVLHLKVADADVDFILQDCDLNADGAIDKSELLRSAPRWQLAEAKVADKKSCACIVS
ncbi:hypothetical protein JL720_10902 [Aureococcus anophagefferens]|nr:hypothetical protein JL720_10902 [Aureococcus anophagefferens]